MVVCLAELLMNIALTQISIKTMGEFIRFVERQENIKTHDEFVDWCSTSLRLLIPFRRMIWGVGERNGEDIRINLIQGIGYPADFINQLNLKKSSIHERAIILQWLTSRQPQIVSKQSAQDTLSALELREFIEFDMENIWAHGVIDTSGLKASYFSFSVPSAALSNNVDPAILLRLVVPHLYEGLKQVWIGSAVKNARPKICIKLTKKEYEILQWIVLGKTNVEISIILSRSVHTIKNQVKILLDKLGAQNRTHASRLAIQYGLITPGESNGSKELL